MASARGDALDWAVALARAPGERHALRQRPLPDGMDTVLQVAGGSHAAAIDEAAAHAGMAPAEVVEAARFYLREMLFFPDADAYRVLGLAADASDEQVKHHHRLLQQWLHPDRPTSDWDAAFAARVNAAWSQLRTPARREAYAATLPVTPAATDSQPSWSPPARIHATRLEPAHADPAFDEGRWRRRAPVLALFGVCAVLGVLAVRDMQQEPERAIAGGEVAALSAAEETPAVALQLPTAAPAPTSKPARAPVAEAKPAPPKRMAAAPAPRVAPTAVAAKPIAKPVAKPVAKPGLKPVSPPAAVAVTRKPLPKPISKPIAIAAAPKPRAVAAKPVAAAVPLPTRQPPMAVAIAPPKVAAATPKAATPVATAPLKPATRPAPVAVAKPPVATVVAVAKPVPTPPIKPAPVAKQVPEPKPTVAAAPAAVAAAATPAAAASPPPPTAQSPAQVAQAQQTGQRLLAYVSGRGGGVPPIWANVASQTQASRAREALQGAGRVDVGTPNWRVGDNSAAMQASLTPRDGAARRLRVDMVWREQRWLVTGLSLEQAP